MQNSVKFVDILQTGAVHFHLKYQNEFLPSNFHEVRGLIFFLFLDMDLGIKH